MNRSALGHVIGYTALTVILTAGAAQSLAGSNMIESDDIIDGVVTSADIKDEGIKGKDIKNGSIEGEELGVTTLGQLGLVYVEAPALNPSSGTTFTHTAECPSLTDTAIAGGGYIDSTRTFISKSYRIENFPPALPGWRVDWATDDSISRDPSSVRAWVLCKTLS